MPGGMTTTWQKDLFDSSLTSIRHGSVTTSSNVKEQRLGMSPACKRTPSDPPPTLQASLQKLYIRAFWPHVPQTEYAKQVPSRAFHNAQQSVADSCIFFLHTPEEVHPRAGRGSKGSRLPPRTHILNMQVLPVGMATATIAAETAPLAMD
jgi:hypothetical protein